MKVAMRRQESGMKLHKWAIGCGILAFLAVVADAQTRAPRRSGPSRPPAPVAQPTAPPAPRVISTTGDEADNTSAAVLPPAPTPTPETPRRPQILRMEDLVIEQNSQRRALNRVAGQLEVLGMQIGFLEAQQRQAFDLQRLIYAEQRADNLRKQLLDTQTKTIEVETRLEQVEYEIRPDVIERTGNFSGSTRPEEVRELRRRTLDNERTRLKAQAEILKTNRIRLEIAVPQADAEVDRIREKLDQDAKDLQEGFKKTDPRLPAPAKPAPTPEVKP